MSNIKNYTLEELEAMKARGETTPTHQDAPEDDFPDDFWDDAEVVVRQKKKSIHLMVDQEVFDYFKSGGRGHLTRMNAVLKSYVQKKNRHTP